MPNPRPRKEFLIPRPRADYSTAELADKMIGLRLFKDIDAVVRPLPDRSAWLRRVITEAAQRELMKDGEI